MKFTFEIIQLPQLSGKKAGFYSILMENEEQTEAEKFIETLNGTHPQKLDNIIARIRVMAKFRGCEDNFFKLREGKVIENICALWEDDIRWYCLKYGKEAVILGGGGIKPKSVGPYQEIPELHNHVIRLQYVLKQIDIRIKERDLWIEDARIKGDLSFREEI